MEIQAYWHIQLGNVGHEKYMDGALVGHIWMYRAKNGYIKYNILRNISSAPKYRSIMTFKREMNDICIPKKPTSHHFRFNMIQPHSTAPPLQTTTPS